LPQPDAALEAAFRTVVGDGLAPEDARRPRRATRRVRLLFVIPLQVLLAGGNSSIGYVCHMDRDVPDNTQLATECER